MSGGRNARVAARIRRGLISVIAGPSLLWCLTHGVCPRATDAPAGATRAADAAIADSLRPALAAQIRDLRSRGEFARAAQVARQWVAALEGALGAPAWEIRQARVTAASLERAAALPADAQQELLEAERLDAQLSRGQSGDVQAVIALLSRQIELRGHCLGDGDAELGAIHDALGLQLQVAGDFHGALEHHRRGLEIREAAFGHEHPDVAISLNNLGLAYYRLGDLARTEPLWREALAIRRRLLGEDDASITGTLNNLGLLFLAQGEYAAAEDHLQEAYERTRLQCGDQHQETLGALSNLAFLYRRQSRDAEAAAMQHRVIDGTRRLLGRDHPDVARAVENLAATLYSQGDLPAAEKHLRDALEIRLSAQGQAHPQTAQVLVNVATVTMDLGRLVEAEPLLREGLALHRQLLDPQHPSTLATLETLALCLCRQYRFDEAEPLLAEAAALFESARLRAGGGFTRATFQSSPYGLLAAARMRLFRENEAWIAAERGLARALADLLEAAGDERLPATEARTFTLPRIQAALPERAALIGWLDVAWSRDAAAAWGYVIRKRGPVTWAALPLSSVKEGGARERVRAFRDQLAAAGTLMLKPQMSSALVAEAQAIWRERLAPLAATLEDVERLIVIPSGAMLGLPVEVLADDEGRFVAERYAVSYAPSATIYAWLQEREREAHLLEGATPGNKDRALLLGDPCFGPDAEGSPSTLRAAAMERRAGVVSEGVLSSLWPLPWTRAEIEGLAPLFDRPTLLLGPRASEQVLDSLAAAGALAQYGTLHLATHALVDDGNPELSALVLTRVGLPDPLAASAHGAPIYDGLLTAGDIVREWKLDADVVVLSACETGLGREVNGEGYVGLVQAFLRAGARGVLVSLWGVNDEATSLLMRRFHEHRFGADRDHGGGERGGHGGDAPSVALREAKAWLRTYTGPSGGRPWEHPYYWSGFILFGAGE